MIALAPLGTRAWPCAGASDPLAMYEARRTLAEREPRLDLAELDDDAVLFHLREHDEHEEDRQRRERLTREIKPPARDAVFEDAVDLHALVERHRLSFLVLDGRGEPFPGVPWRLFEQGRLAAEGKLGQDGMVRRESVAHDDYALELVEIVATRWVKGAADTHAIELDCTGIADGTALQVLVFEELREQDGEELATLAATVQGDRARVEWTIAADRLAELADEDGGVRLMAEVRGPGGTWRKTDEPLLLAAPTVVAIAWAEPGELVATTRGVADGTTARCEIWRAPIAGEPERLAEITDVRVEGGRARVRWTAPASDNGLECWPLFVLDAPGAPSASGPRIFLAAS